ncbi:MAG: hypothetical protein GY737_00345 [Desulfobacteraceae bacterium]|nr:hypothetical protein [Desulfobacteraceae bacterium]
MAATDMFTTDTEGTPIPPAEPITDPVDDTEPFTQDEVQEMLNEAVSGSNEQAQALATQLAQTQQSLARLEGQVSAQPQVAHPEDTTPFADRLVNDPEGVIEQKAKDANADLRERLEASEVRYNQVAHIALIQAEANAVDAEFGAGTYQEILAPQLNAHFANQTGAAANNLADPEWVKVQVNAVKGFKIQDLVTKGQATRDATVTKQNEDLAKLIEATQAGNMTGGIAPVDRSNPNELTEAEKEYNKSLEKGGMPALNIAQIRAAQDSDGSVDDILARIKAQKGAAQ